MSDYIKKGSCIWHDGHKWIIKDIYNPNSWDEYVVIERVTTYRNPDDSNIVYMKLLQTSSSNPLSIDGIMESNEKTDRQIEAVLKARKKIRQRESKLYERYGNV